MKLLGEIFQVIGACTVGGVLGTLIGCSLYLVVSKLIERINSKKEAKQATRGKKRNK